jgi:OmpA-OmpF porin, OOP family
MRLAWLRGLLFAVLALLPARSASAGDCRPLNGVSPCIDSDNLWPHAGGGPYFAIGDTSTTPAGELSFGLVGSFFTKSVGVRVVSADPAGSSVFLIDTALDVTLLFALGITDRLELTLAAPATLYQTGAGLAQVDGSAAPLTRSLPRDVRFGFAVAILRRPPDHDGPALAGRLEFDAPTGDDDNFAHGPTAVVIPSLSFSYRIGRVDLAAETMARLRGEAVFANAVVGTQIGVALGASVDILRDRWLSAGAEAFVLPTTAPQLPDPATGATVPLVPAEWIAHASTAHFMGGDLVLALGGGGTIPFSSHAALTSPAYRLDFSVRFAPTAPQGANRSR